MTNEFTIEGGLKTFDNPLQYRHLCAYWLELEASVNEWFKQNPTVELVSFDVKPWTTGQVGRGGYIDIVYRKRGA